MTFIDAKGECQEEGYVQSLVKLGLTRLNPVVNCLAGELSPR